MERLTEFEMNSIGFAILCNFPRFCGEERAKEASDMLRAMKAEIIAYRALGTVEELSALVKARNEGRVVVLPCAVGQTVWVISKCENVRMSRDDDYLTGTCAIECPFESSCDAEDCDDSHIRIFETLVSDFWYGDENEKRPEMFLEHMGTGYMRSDFGKTVFLTRAEAKAAIGGGGDGA